MIDNTAQLKHGHVKEQSQIVHSGKMKKNKELYEKFEDTNGVMRSLKSNNNRQYKGQIQNYKH